MSAALVATTEHDDPASPKVSSEPITKHEPEDTAYETEPVPEPPDVVRESTEPYVPEVEVMVKLAWFACPMETDAVAESAAR